MESTLFQTWLTIFCQKAPNFVHFGQYDFVQTSPACGPNTVSNNVSRENVDFQCQHQQR